jgi:PAS domain S-box-containing protein
MIYLESQLLMLQKQIEDLQNKLEEARANLDAIQSGVADAIVVQTDSGVAVFTIQGAETAYRIMVETMNEGAVTIDSDGFILYVNNRFCTMIDSTYAKLVGTKFVSFLNPDYLYEFENILKKSASGINYHKDFELIRSDNHHIPVYLSSAPLELLGRHDICLIITDLTERNLVQHKLVELNFLLEQKVRERTKELEQLTESLEQQVNHRTGQVRELAKALSLAEQKQRQRLSVILHENIQQTLFALKTRFNLLKLTIDSITREELSEDLNQLDTLSSKALDTSKQLAIEFNPPILHNEGLDAALKWLVHHIEKNYGLHVNLEIQDPFLFLPEEERILIVNLIRELLYNVVKHAGTQSADVIVDHDLNHIIIKTIDKGSGFDLKNEILMIKNKTHTGLFSIEERLRFFGGTLIVDSQPGKGTTIIMTMPFDPKHKQLCVE